MDPLQQRQPDVSVNWGMQAFLLFWIVFSWIWCQMASLAETVSARSCPTRSQCRHSRCPRAAGQIWWCLALFQVFTLSDTKDVL